MLTNGDLDAGVGCQTQQPLADGDRLLALVESDFVHVGRGPELGYGCLQLAIESRTALLFWREGSGLARGGSVHEACVDLAQRDQVVLLL